MPTGQAGMSMFIPMILIFVIFYMLVFRPQKKEQKQKQDMRNNLKKNDQVVTIGGIHGTVVLLKDKTVILRVDDSVKIEFDKESISSAMQSNSQSST